MINIQKLIEEANENGYQGDKASAKVCQDIVLKALSVGPLSRNVTIKGGVVMRSKTNNVRRATQDLDIDFIKYSLADESIDAFISKLNCLDGIKISMLGKIEELKQQDYSGKQVFILIEDTEGNQVRSKIDLGVHNRFELEQEEYCFDIAYDDEGASLLINSDEQMLAEKLMVALDTYIFNDTTMKENTGNDIVRRLKIAFSDKSYIHRLDTSDKRWIDEEIGVVTERILEFMGKFC